MFRVLDTDKDNMVSWREVMVGFHQLSPSGDPDQKLKLVYSVSTILYSCKLTFKRLYTLESDVYAHKFLKLSLHKKNTKG